MKYLYGIITLGGFMATMLCYVLARVEVTKPELVITFFTWLGLEALFCGFRRLVRSAEHIQG